jgi:hypothetical protein
MAAEAFVLLLLSLCAMTVDGAGCGATGILWSFLAESDFDIVLYAVDTTTIHFKVATRAIKNSGGDDIAYNAQTGDMVIASWPFASDSQVLYSIYNTRAQTLTVSRSAASLGHPSGRPLHWFVNGTLWMALWTNGSGSTSLSFATLSIGRTSSAISSLFDVTLPPGWTFRRGCYNPDQSVYIFYATIGVFGSVNLQTGVLTPLRITGGVVDSISYSTRFGCYFALQYFEGKLPGWRIVSISPDFQTVAEVLRYLIGRKPSFVVDDFVGVLYAYSLKNNATAWTTYNVTARSSTTGCACFDALPVSLPLFPCSA